MGIDIRDIPTVYINMDKDIKRRQHMENILAKNGFKNYRRLSAYTSGGTDVYHSLFASHVRACYSLLNESSPYVLVLEDDVIFTDIPRLNAAINEAIKNDDFELFTISRCTDEPQCYTPPKEHDYLAHFVLYKRERIPLILVQLFQIWLISGKNDIWGLYKHGAYIYTGDDCIQLGFYFPTNNPLGNCVNRKVVICVTTDADIKGRYVHDVFNEVSNNALSSSMLSNMRDSLIRIYKYQEGSMFMELLTSTGELCRIDLPLKVLSEYEESKDKTVLYRHGLYWEGLNGYTLLKYDTDTHTIQTVKI